jgi:hypothetical protein
MKIRIFIPLVLATTLVCGYPPPQDVRANTLLIAQSIWKPFSSQEGGFRVLLPGTPSQNKDNVNTQVGSIPVNLFFVDRPEAFYGVAYADFPGNTPINSNELNQALPQLASKYIDNMGGKVVSQKTVSLGNISGKEIRVRFPQGVIARWRVYAVNKRLYEVVVVTDKESSLTKSIEGFFKSFQLLNNSTDAQKPSLPELGESLRQAVCSQNWPQALKLADQMIAIAPDEQTRRQLTDYRSQIQGLASSGSKIPPESLPAECAGKK